MHIRVSTKALHRELLLNDRSGEYILADSFSCNATLNLINWHRRNEGGLWLAGDENDDDKIRKLQSHSWIEIVDSDEEYDSADEVSDRAVTAKEASIKEWQDRVTGATYPSIALCAATPL